jgi:hypothetical protein
VPTPAERIAAQLAKHAPKLTAPCSEAVQDQDDIMNERHQEPTFDVEPDENDDDEDFDIYASSTEPESEDEEEHQLWEMRDRTRKLYRQQLDEQPGDDVEDAQGLEEERYSHGWELEYQESRKVLPNEEEHLGKEKHRKEEEWREEERRREEEDERRTERRREEENERRKEERRREKEDQRRKEEDQRRKAKLRKEEDRRRQKEDEHQQTERRKEEERRKDEHRKEQQAQGQGNQARHGKTSVRPPTTRSATASKRVMFILPVRVLH